MPPRRAPLLFGRIPLALPVHNFNEIIQQSLAFTAHYVLRGPTATIARIFNIIIVFIRAKQMLIKITNYFR